MYREQSASLPGDAVVFIRSDDLTWQRCRARDLRAQVEWQSVGHVEVFTEDGRRVSLEVRHDEQRRPSVHAGECALSRSEDVRALIWRDMIEGELVFGGSPPLMSRIRRYVRDWVEPNQVAPATASWWTQSDVP